MTSPIIKKTNDSLCFHCGELLPHKTYAEYINKQEQHFCCPACLAVSQIIHNQGLSSYYQNRQGYSHKPADETPFFQWMDDPEIQLSFSEKINPTTIHTQLHITGIHCAACCWLIEKHLLKISGVIKAQVSLHQQKASITFNPNITSLSVIAQKISQLGYEPSPWQVDRLADQYQQQKKQLLKRLGVAGLGMMQVGMASIALYIGDHQGMDDSVRYLLQIFSMLITLFVLIYSCRTFFSSAWRGLKNKSPGMDVPVSIAIILAFLASVYNTANHQHTIYYDSVCMFAFFLLMARFIELVSRSHFNAQKNLLPKTAWVEEDGKLKAIPLAHIKIGDVLTVKAGETIPVDGNLIKGEAHVDQSAFSGEFELIKKTSGDMVFAGTTNSNSTIQVLCQTLSNQSRIFKINQSLDKALAEKPKISELVDKISIRFVSAVLFLTITTFIYWAFFSTNELASYQFAFVTALSVLVVSCPCALSLATPTALASATFALKKQGFIVSSGKLLTSLNSITHVVFDKTGTLTEKKLSIKETINQGDATDKYYLEIIGSLEKLSNHPIASLFYESSDDMDNASIKEIINQGVYGKDKQNNEWQFGKPHFSSNQPSVLLPNTVDNWLLLSKNQQPQFWVAIDDTLQKESYALIKKLQKKMTVSLLSGDQKNATMRIANALNITDVFYEKSPEEKVSIVQSMQSKGDRVLMVGDGVNDAPVLATANASIATNSASDLSKAHSDAYLLSHLLTILQAFQHAKKTNAIIKQNITWAVVYNFSAIPFAMMGIVPPWLAAIGMSLSSIFVCLNANRLTRIKPIH